MAGKTSITQQQGAREECRSCGRARIKVDSKKGGRLSQRVRVVAGKNAHLESWATCPGAGIGQICRAFSFGLPVTYQLSRRFETCTASDPSVLASFVMDSSSRRVFKPPLAEGLSSCGEVAAKATSQVRGNREASFSRANRDVLMTNDGRRKYHNTSSPQLDDSTGFVKNEVAALVNVVVAVNVVETNGGSFITGVAMRLAYHPLACVNRRSCKARVWNWGPKLRVNGLDRIDSLVEVAVVLRKPGTKPIYPLVSLVRAARVTAHLLRSGIERQREGLDRTLLKRLER